MKKSNVFCAILVCTLLICSLSSCMSFKMPVSTSNVNTRLVEKDYEILGRVKLEGESTLILGIYGTGGATYNELLEQAVKQYGADEVVNITTDMTSKYYFGVLVKQGWIMTGLAIKYLD